jgi:hypothetical protein
MVHSNKAKAKKLMIDQGNATAATGIYKFIDLD